MPHNNVSHPLVPMQLTMMKGKVHRASVTRVELEYEGSMGIDAYLLEQAGILPYEAIDVYNIANGARFSTYAIKAPAHSGTIAVYGAAAHLVNVGDKVIICAFAQMAATAAVHHKPRVVLVDGENRVKTMVSQAQAELVGDE